MSAKIRKITFFFIFFEIEMTFILESPWKQHIKGHFISFKWERNVHFLRVVFVIFDFEEGRTRNYQKIRRSKLQNF